MTRSSPDSALKNFKEIEELLCDLETYFDDRADADHNGDHFIPNKEMKLVMRIREVLPRLAPAQAAQSSAVNEVELRNDLGKTLDILRGPNYPGGSAIMAIADAFSMIEVIISKLPDEQARCSRCGGIVDIDTIGQTSHDVYGCPARLSADTASPQAAGPPASFDSFAKGVAAGWDAREGTPPQAALSTDDQLREAMDLLHKARLDSIHQATENVRLRNTIVDTIEALERNSTSAPVVECLKAALSRPEQPKADTIVVSREDLIEMLCGWEEGAAYKGDYLRNKHGDTEQIAKLRERYLK